MKVARVYLDSSCGKFPALGPWSQPCKYFYTINSKVEVCAMIGGFFKCKIRGWHSLEKSLNLRGSPWKVLEFYFSLKSTQVPVLVLESPGIFFNFECSGLESVFWPPHDWKYFCGCRLCACINTWKLKGLDSREIASLPEIKMVCLINNHLK